jgi:hypothetical protein
MKGLFRRGTLGVLLGAPAQDRRRRLMVLLPVAIHGMVGPDPSIWNRWFLSVLVRFLLCLIRRSILPQEASSCLQALEAGIRRVYPAGPVFALSYQLRDYGCFCFAAAL